MPQKNSTKLKVPESSLVAMGIGWGHWHCRNGVEWHVCLLIDTQILSLFGLALVCSSSPSLLWLVLYSMNKPLKHCPCPYPMMGEIFAHLTGLSRMWEHLEVSGPYAFGAWRVLSLFWGTVVVFWNLQEHWKKTVSFVLDVVLVKLSSILMAKAGGRFRWTFSYALTIWNIIGDLRAVLQVAGIVLRILQDTERRKIYDTFGTDLGLDFFADQGNPFHKLWWHPCPPNWGCIYGLLLQLDLSETMQVGCW